MSTPTEKMLSRYHKLMVLARETDNDGERASAVERLKSLETKEPSLRWVYPQWLAGREKKPRRPAAPSPEQRARQHSAGLRAWLHQSVGPKSGDVLMGMGKVAAAAAVEALFADDDDSDDGEWG